MALSNTFSYQIRDFFLSPEEDESSVTSRNPNVAGRGRSFHRQRSGWPKTSCARGLVALFGRKLHPLGERKGKGLVPAEPFIAPDGHARTGVNAGPVSQA